MAANQAIEYAPQYGDLTIESLAFTITPLVLYQNFLREFWCTAIAYDPSPPSDDSIARLLKEYLIKFLVMNGKKPLTLDFKTFVEFTGLDYKEGTNVSHPSLESIKAKLAKIDENFGSLPSILSNFNFSKHPSKVTKIELMASMIVVNNLESLVSPLPFSGKNKKGKSQKRKKAKTDKTTPKATKTPPTEDVPTKDSEKTHSVSSGQTAHP
ncbi:hypothetical protein Tco_0585884 [Tanacetum coccineum]